MKYLGVDIGSTTMKYVLLDERFNILESSYERHYSRIREIFTSLAKKFAQDIPSEELSVAISGSAGMGFAEKLGLSFVQEVYAERLAVNKLCPGTDVVVELGGEDAKIVFLTGGFEMRMNGSCAGGTGAFIDQMASLMKITPEQLNEMAGRCEKIYPIASRCGVFAKSDVQPLLNQGARKEDVAAGIFRAVVNQTVGGLAQGRRIEGNVLYLGGPLSFMENLRKSFDDVLGIHGVCPKNSLYYVAYGAAISGVGVSMTPPEMLKLITQNEIKGEYNSCPPLFKSQEEYDEFTARHKKAAEGINEIDAPSGPMFLGIDAGSTTVKALLCDKNGNIFKPFYASNHGNPIEILKGYLTELYTEFPNIEIASSAVTGYGEQLVRDAFGVDLGIVETIAHYRAASKFRPDVDFILDIGGQDIKCFRIRNGLIDSLFLNEACSSGCGSFLQTFAENLGYSTADFAKLGLFAKAPVDLGSRCTVFMNSSVKQAQKDGAGVENIAAGLSISVVKNALYKVIRTADAKALGKHIVVQGGTFLNDCVLRAFEQELGCDVIRPAYSGLMGAYGAALYASEHVPEKSGILTLYDLEHFEHETKQITCGGCQNHCELTMNIFSGGRRSIAGNRCSKPLGGRTGGAAAHSESFNIYEYKRELLAKYKANEIAPGRKTIGLPMGLNFYELLPFWATFFKELGFNVLVSPDSDRQLYTLGQQTIPSDTVCYPAKLMHGHIEWLMEKKPDAVFYPDMTYNTDEKKGQDHFNCPVVAYYPQVLRLNVPGLQDLSFIDDFISISDEKQFERRICEIFAAHSEIFGSPEKKQVHAAARAAYEEYENYFKLLRAKAAEYRRRADEKNMPIMVLSGRPYHVDPEVNHGIDRLLCDLGCAVLSEDSISDLTAPFAVNVRNQWTYHARLYAAAKYIAESPDAKNMHLIQLVSFGCGVDAITTDEVRSILESEGHDYTQLKIDEISNMGAVTIRLRSLLAMLEGK